VSVAVPARPRPRAQRQQQPAPSRARSTRSSTRARRGAGLSRKGLLWLISLTALLGGIVAVNVAALRASIDVNRLNAQAQALEQHNRDLNATVTSLSAPLRVNRLAAHYHMVRPVVPPSHYMRLHPRHRRAHTAP